jgi:hypothetical protein
VELRAEYDRLTATIARSGAEYRQALAQLSALRQSVPSALSQWPDVAGEDAALVLYDTPLTRTVRVAEAFELVCLACIDAARPGGISDNAVGGSNLRGALTPLFNEMTFRSIFGPNASSIGVTAQQVLTQVQQVAGRMREWSTSVETIRREVPAHLRKARKPSDAA